MNLADAEAEVFRILSKNGVVKRRNCDLIGQATWDAYERGFMACFNWVNPVIYRAEILETGDKLRLSHKGIQWVVIEKPTKYSSQVHIRSVEKYNTRCMRMSYRNKYLDPAIQVFDIITEQP
jgi:hypothetical protein